MPNLSREQAGVAAKLAVTRCASIPRCRSAEPEAFAQAASLIQRRWIRLPPSALLAVGALARRQLAGRERRRRGAALFEVLVGLRFLLFLVAAHLTLGHDVSPWRPVERCGAPT